MVATAFADLGFDVDMGPLFQTPEECAARPSRTTCTPWASRCRRPQDPGAGHHLAELRKQGADDIIVFVGGVIPQQDYDFLYEAGVKASTARHAHPGQRQGRAGADPPGGETAGVRFA